MQLVLPLFDAYGNRREGGTAQQQRSRERDSSTPLERRLGDYSTALVSMSNEVFSECLKMIFEQISQLLMLLFGHGISRQGRYISV
jgi:hypothetical protein